MEFNVVEIYSTTGKKVATHNEKILDLNSLENGFYFIKVIGNDYSSTRRILKK